MSKSAADAINAENARIWEKERLRDAVVEAAKTWERGSLAGENRWSILALTAKLSIAVRDLIEFESQLEGET